MSDLQALEPTHVAGGAGGDRHVPGREQLRIRLQVELGSAGLEQGAVLGLVVDLDLGVVRPHVTLSAGLRLSRKRDRGRVLGVAVRAGSEGAILVGLATIVAALAPHADGSRSLE